ncbi:guanine deaminase [Vanessa cardui]|uniref:guanine deaminase n=1 Tax=Vanessa cardui TaxID=171605 RepID=UPI001F12EE04|nr:guanine deaminase [Vanessa cardui]
MSNKMIFVGDIILPSLSNLKCISAYLIVENGLITERGAKDDFYKYQENFIKKGYQIIILEPHQFLMPGFVDCHTHAPQFPNIGLGLDRPLLEWLDKYTFPLERQYSDEEFAANVYSKVVKRLINNGTTTACYFGTLHLAGTLELVKSVIKQNQRAFIGKVSMNIENDAGYYNDTEKELREVKTFVEKVFEYNNDLVNPVITPRFAISCDNDLMRKLSVIAKENSCLIQSHISENKKEIEYVLSTNPECSSYSEVYGRCGLFDNKCIMAHGVHLTEEEIDMFVRKGASVAHCPASNTRLKSGLCPVRKLLNREVKVGLGTDVSGGDNASILDALRRAMDVSEHLNMLGGKESALNWKEALYLATLGGARALFIDDKIGCLEVNREFDALLIDLYSKNSPIDKYTYSVAQGEEEEILERVERFVYLGDDRNIVQVYVKGKKVKDIL